ncbi:MAG: IS6 family transposase, partial [Gammaproteobacteria bacterium]|nr:IS6 family transposase [Gammaproteobacteria bacterium]
CRTQRFGKCGKKWHADATYLKIEGRWCYLYRAIDKEGNLVDVYLSDVRDQAAAEAFFEQATKTAGIIPTQIPTDKERALYSAIDNVFGENTKHRDSKYMNNIIEQNHRGIKSRYKVMKGFKNIFSALIFCTAFEEVRQIFSAKNKTRSERRSQFMAKFCEMKNLLATAA